jgi:hypothetical protein
MINIYLKIKEYWLLKAKRMNSRKVYIDEIQLLTCGIAKSCVCERERQRERERDLLPIMIILDLKD